MNTFCVTKTLFSFHFSVFSVRIRVLDSIQMRMRTVRYGMRSRMQMPGPLLYGTAPYYGTGARADARIRTSVRIRVSFLKPGTASFLKLKSKKKHTWVRIRKKNSSKQKMRTHSSFILMRQCKIQMRMRTVRYGMRSRMQMPGP